jgi:hypothetical protein
MTSNASRARSIAYFSMEIALEQESDSNQRQIAVRCRADSIARQNAQAAAVSCDSCLPQRLFLPAS